MKAYFFYLNGTLYAYTTNKEHKKLFESQRCAKAFEIQTMRLSKEAFEEFDDMNYKYKLSNIVIHDGYDYLEIIGTPHEDDLVDTFITQLIGEFRDVLMFFYEMPIKNRHRKLIDELTHTVEMIPREDECGKYDQYFNVNQLRVFYTLFEETFPP